MSQQPTAESVSQPLFAAPIRHLLGIVAAIGCGWLGSQGGIALSYAVAAWTDRDIAELKDMLIWSRLGGGLVGALAGVWLVLLFTRCRTEARRLALIATGVAVVIDASLMLVSFDWPKSAGIPVVHYELRLPAGHAQPAPGKADVTLWAEKSGKGCYVAALRRVDERPEIAGSCLVTSKSDEQALSLRLNRETESYLAMPIRADARLDAAFGPWQRVEFVPSPRGNLRPLPPGEYDIRYRVKKYM